MKKGRFNFVPEGHCKYQKRYRNTCFSFFYVNVICIKNFKVVVTKSSHLGLSIEINIWLRSANSLFALEHLSLTRRMISVDSIFGLNKFISIILIWKLRKNLDWEKILCFCCIVGLDLKNHNKRVMIHGIQIILYFVGRILP